MSVPGKPTLPRNSPFLFSHPPRLLTTLHKPLAPPRPFPSCLSSSTPSSTTVTRFVFSQSLISSPSETLLTYLLLSLILLINSARFTPNFHNAVHHPRSWCVRRPRGRMGQQQLLVLCLHHDGDRQLVHHRVPGPDQRRGG